MRYPAVVLDVDGLVIVSPRFSERLQRDFGISWDTMKPFFSGPFALCKLGRADLKEELARVVGAWGWQGTVDELVRYWFAEDRPNAEVLALVGELRGRGVRCYLGTNQEKYRAAHLWNELRLSAVFGGAFVSADLGASKDDPGFFRTAYARLEDDFASVGRGPVVPGSVLFVDHEQKNLDAAAAAGWSTHLFDGLSGFRKALGI
jgi:putative hydrolase of the HAD superfamily